MRRAMWAAMAGWLSLAATGGTVQQQVTDLGQGVYQYDFQLTGFSLTAGEALDFQFDPASYSSLSNPTAAAALIVFDFQPNQPPGASGDFIVENPASGTMSFTGPFDIDLTLTNLGQVAAVPYNLYSVDSNGSFAFVSSDVTVLEGGILATPEPASFLFAGLSLLCAGIWRKRFAAR